MEMAWQKRKRLGEERAKEALQADKEALQADKKAAKEALQVTEKALQAVNESGSTVRNLYFTFLLLAVYIGIIIASTTDRQLLLISPVTLPLLNVQLPILGFYIFVPWLFLLVHFNLLLQLFLLSHKLRIFARASAVLSTEEAAPLRERLIDFPAVQLLANLQYDRFIQWLLALVVWITVLLLPLVVLLWAQVRFLPFHNAHITWGQRTAVLLDVLMLLLFWPRLVFGQGALGWWIRCLAFWRRGQNYVNRGTGLVLGAVTLVTLMLSLLVATVPNERWETWLLAYMPASWKSTPASWKSAPDRLSRPAAFYPTLMLRRNLELRRQLLTANELPADVQYALYDGTAQQKEQALQKVQGLDLQDRDLCYAILTESLLPKANLRGAKLQDADLQGAHLQGAILIGADLQDADLQGAHLQGAILIGADLQRADLWQAELQGANLWRTELQGAVLAGTIGLPPIFTGEDSKANPLPQAQPGPALPEELYAIPICSTAVPSKARRNEHEHPPAPTHAPTTGRQD